MNGTLTGTGIKTDPYIIEDAYDLNEIRNDIYGYYILKNNIDMSEFNTLSAIGWAPIQNFYGVIDGRGHYIANLNIINSSTNNFGFIVVLCGILKNFGFVNANIIGKDNISGFCYNGLYQATIENCFILGNIQGNSSVSSFANIWNSPNFKNNFSKANISCTQYGAGLIYTINTGSILKNSYFDGKIAQTTGIGNGGVATNSGGTISNVFYNSEKAGSTAGVGTAYTTALMNTASTWNSYKDEYISISRKVWEIKDGEPPLLTYLTDNKYVVKCNNQYMTVMNNVWHTFSNDVTVIPTDAQFKQYGMNGFEISLISKTLWNDLRKYGKFEFTAQANRYEYPEVFSTVEFTKFKEIPGAVLYKAPLDISKLTDNLVSVEIIQQ